QSVVPQQNLSYSAPAADGSVEVRNQQGQVVGASQKTGSAFGVTEPSAPAQVGQQGVRQAPPPAPRQAPPAGNRAQRRAQKKKKR
ncbi:MAG: hypothetical protein ACPG20_04155, partial [Pontimonas sp.]